MDILIYILSIPAITFAGYIAFTRQQARIALTLFLYPVIINGIDVFVDGNLTTFRQIAFTVWGFLALWAVITNKGK